MKKYVRSVASMVVMGVFLILAWSCSEEYQGEKLLVCQWFQTPISKNQEVFIKVIDRISKKPIPDAEVDYTIIESFVKKATESNGYDCILEIGSFNLINQTGTEGIFYIPIERQYKSSFEYTRIRISVRKQGYAGESIDILLKPNDNGARKDIYLLPAELNP